MNHQKGLIMTRQQAKELSPAITHFANGGNLWYDNGLIWNKQEEIYTQSDYHSNNIIEDKHFEARKAFALGEEIENQYGDTYRMKDGLLISHSKYLPFSEENIDRMDYKINFKEPVYEYQWVIRRNRDGYLKTTKHITNSEFICDNTWQAIYKIPESKRIKK